MSLNLSCPQGGTWHACSGNDDTGFLGCCVSNPCSFTCSAGNLRPASFDPADYGKLQDQSCPDQGSQFWTCNFTTPTFLGCCKSNPCQQNGCPTGDLTSAALKSDSAAAPFLSSSESSSMASATGSAASSSETSIPSPDSSVTASPDSHDHSDTGTISGAIVGGLLGLAVIVSVVFIYFQHLKRRRRASLEQSQPDSSGPSPSDKHKETLNIGLPKSSRSAHSHHLSTATLSPFSPGPPSYVSEGHETLAAQMRHTSYELPADVVPGAASAQRHDVNQWRELESGQCFHPYRPDRSYRQTSPSHDPVVEENTEG